MLQRITDMWPNLLRGFQPGQDDNDEGEDQPGNPLELGRLDIQIDEAHINTEFKNLFWTRLMIVENYECDHTRKFALAPDIIEECQAVADLPPVDPETWQPLFEPGDFNDEHGPLEIDTYKLD